MEYKSTEINKVNTNSNKNLDEIRDKVDLIQKSQTYIHNHITESEAKIEAKIDALLRVIADALKVLLQQHQGG